MLAKSPDPEAGHGLWVQRFKVEGSVLGGSLPSRSGSLLLRDQVYTQWVSRDI